MKKLIIAILILIIIGGGIFWYIQNKKKLALTNKANTPPAPASIVITGKEKKEFNVQKWVKGKAVFGDGSKQIFSWYKFNYYPVKAGDNLGTFMGTAGQGKASFPMVLSIKDNVTVIGLDTDITTNPLITGFFQLV